MSSTVKATSPGTLIDFPFSYWPCNGLHFNCNWNLGNSIQITIWTLLNSIPDPHVKWRQECVMASYSSGYNFLLNHCHSMVYGSDLYWRKGWALYQIVKKNQMLTIVQYTQTWCFCREMSYPYNSWSSCSSLALRLNNRAIHRETLGSNIQITGSQSLRVCLTNSSAYSTCSLNK